MPVYRFRFRKEGDLRFISHLDTSHAFERAARRAKVPLAFTQGFHPHPKIAFATALAVGTTSEAEYVDIETVRGVKIVELMKSLNDALPEGMGLIEGVMLPNGVKALMATVSHADYDVVLDASGVSGDDLAGALDRLMAMDAVPVTKRTKSGVKQVDIRPFMSGLIAEGNRVRMSLACGSTGMAKPEDVVEALRVHAGLDGVAMASCHRTALYSIRDGRNTDLLEG